MSTPLFQSKAIASHQPIREHSVEIDTSRTIATIQATIHNEKYLQNLTFSDEKGSIIADCKFYLVDQGAETMIAPVPKGFEIIGL